ncbi:MAG: uracil-DNA glycosylase [Deltaproteobacteria bacterium]|nr:uracil-DNA glycosylase [Deltaproteobacteria bacterium]
MSQGRDRKETGRSDVAAVARDLAARVRWESELGGAGYRASASPTRVAARGRGAPDRDPAQALATLRAEIGDCTRCRLHEGRTLLVYGEGNPAARLVFVGEGPGRDEDVSGRPFVGAAGQLLTRIIEAIGLERSEVYICNVVKCRPPENRAPASDETDTCGPFLRRQLEILSPQVVVALGATAAHFLTGRNEPMGRLRGRFHEASGLKIMPTYHPAYLLRSPEAKRPVWEDMQQVQAALGLKPAPRKKGS